MCLPKMMGNEASGAAAIVHDLVFENPETVGTAIRIGNPASWKQAVAARDESGGVIDEIKDEQMISANQRMAENEGIFAEPASNTSIAGLFKVLEEGKVEKGAKVVCVLTGNGIKDPDTAIEFSTIKPTVLPNDYDVVIEKIVGRGSQ